jgi:two-component system phosphate regulon sensor histidine kinase PhoR
MWTTSRQASRVRQLERVARRLGRGDPGVRAREQPPDEIGRLGQAINHMAAEARDRLVALERERDERETILVHMRDGVALIDATGRVVRMNRSMAELVGLPLPAEAGTALQEYLRSPQLDEMIRSALAQDRVIEADLRLWSPGERHLRASATPIGAPVRDAVLLVLHDVSEAERLNRMRQDFVANVSHELRTPLTSLRGYAETLLEGGLDDAENRERFILVIRDQAVRLEALTKDLLTLAELERPGAQLRPESLDLRGIAEAQTAAFRDRARRAGLELLLDDGPPENVVADRSRLEQVVANLLDNAIKYTERGEVRVVMGGDDANVWCEVRDTGPGIPAEDQPRVFERFYRVDKARSREKGGTGLGLSIVKHIVALHGGEVSVTSAPRRGSVFRFEIPRTPVDLG